MRDQRSWRDDLLIRQAAILKNSVSSSYQQLAEPLLRLHNKVLSLKASSLEGNQNAANAEDEDVPDEFLDPLTYTVMADPVMLTTSKQCLDRGTLKKHLLNDPHDPFNRAPVEWSRDVQELPELKAKIQAWLQDRRQKQQTQKNKSE